MKRASFLLERLQKQHQRDVQVYRSAHKDPRNVLLHKILIPIECWSALMLGLWLPVDFVIVVDSVKEEEDRLLVHYLGRFLPPATTLGLGILSYVLAKQQRNLLGVLTLLFHVLTIVVSWELMQWHRYHHHGRYFRVVPLAAMSSWIVAWILQVGVGHYLWERNSPNVANMQEISYLAMCQSVLIAWSV